MFCFTSHILQERKKRVSNVKSYLNFFSCNYLSFCCCCSWLNNILVWHASYKIRCCNSVSIYIIHLFFYSFHLLSSNFVLKKFLKLIFDACLEGKHFMFYFILFYFLLKKKRKIYYFSFVC